MESEPSQRRQILPGFPQGPRAHLQRPGRQVMAPWVTCWVLLHDLPESSQGPGQLAPLILGLEPMVCSTLQNVLPFLVPKSQVRHFMICLLMWPRSSVTLCECVCRKQRPVCAGPTEINRITGQKAISVTARG